MFKFDKSNKATWYPIDNAIAVYFGSTREPGPRQMRYAKGHDNPLSGYAGWLSIVHELENHSLDAMFTARNYWLNKSIECPWIKYTLEDYKRELKVIVWLLENVEF